MRRLYDCSAERLGRARNECLGALAFLYPPLDALRTVDRGLLYRVSEGAIDVLRQCRSSLGQSIHVYWTIVGFSLVSQ